MIHILVIVRSQLLYLEWLSQICLQTRLTYMQNLLHIFTKIYCSPLSFKFKLKYLHKLLLDVNESWRRN